MHEIIILLVAVLVAGGLWCCLHGGKEELGEVRKRETDKE